MQDLHAEVRRLQAIAVRHLDLRQHVCASCATDVPALTARHRRRCCCHRRRKQLPPPVPPPPSFHHQSGPTPVTLQISDVVAAQQANREALAALKGSSSGGGNDSASSSADSTAWVLRPGGVWLALPSDKAQLTLRHESHQLAERLEQLFEQQKTVLAELQKEGLSPEHFTL